MTSPAIVRQTQFLVALAEAGIEPDIQELLVAGNPSRGIAPGALAKALAALDATPGEGVRQDFSRITLRHNIKALVHRHSDAHPETLINAIMEAIPVGAYPHDDATPGEGDADFLKDLARRLHKTGTPAMGFDQGDVDQLYRIARSLPAAPLSGGDSLA